jgi:hypothetical protein
MMAMTCVLNFLIELSQELVVYCVLLFAGFLFLNKLLLFVVVVVIVMVD